MTVPALLATAVLVAASPDPGPPAKDCTQFEAHYRALLQRQAELDVAQARKPGDPVSPTAEHVEARDEASQVAGELEGAVRQACRRANGSQYECVVTANGYEALTYCALPGLPLLARDARRSLPTSEPPPTPEERAAADRAVVEEYVRSGTIDLEALGTGSAAPGAGPSLPAAAAAGE